eukprot:3296296-Rhodomonas_salina.1
MCVAETARGVVWQKATETVTDQMMLEVQELLDCVQIFLYMDSLFLDIPVLHTDIFVLKVECVVQELFGV